MAFLLIFFLLPFLVVFKISVSEMDNVVFRDLWVWTDGALSLRIKLSNYAALVGRARCVSTSARRSPS